MGIRCPSPDRTAPSYAPLSFYLAQSSSSSLVVIYDPSDPLIHIRSAELAVRATSEIRNHVRVSRIAWTY